MALASLGAFGVASPIQHEDVYKVAINKGAGVTFYCPSRSTSVQGVLAKPISINSTAKWEAFLGSAGSFMGVADTVTQALAGTSIHQPWMSRCAYQGTDPLRFDITVDFSTSIGNPLGTLGMHNAFKEVYIPAMELLGFTVPRAGQGSGVVGKGVSAITDALNRGTQWLEKSFGADLGVSFEQYILPGPTFNGEGGDKVEVYIGNIIAMTFCYITNVSLSVDNVFDPAGYPTHIEAKVTVQCADKPYMTGQKYYNSANIGFVKASDTSGDYKVQGLAGGNTSALGNTASNLLKKVKSSSIYNKAMSAISKTTIGGKVVETLGWSPFSLEANPAAFGSSGESKIANQSSIPGIPSSVPPYAVRR